MIVGIKNIVTNYRLSTRKKMSPHHSTYLKECPCGECHRMRINNGTDYAYRLKIRRDVDKILRELGKIKEAEKDIRK